ncbi:MAG: ATP-dependent zinc metalloprotease FtsH [Methylococcaceae bacterium]|nr:ATP-dependent zinc metalloprotease FtsH [Methylococcaceae bacterium]
MLSNIGSHGRADASKPYSEFIQLLQDGQISQVEIDGFNIQAKTRVGIQFETYNPGDLHLVDDLLANDVAIKTKPPERQSWLREIFISWSPMLLLILAWIYFMRRSQGGGLGPGGMKLGESKAKLLHEDQLKVTFADVAGVEEAKEEVSEMVDFLRDPGKFEHIGGKIPRGALMVGPPGTGKTLLARAIAGEAKVPFFTISGSDFVEMFVGVGASRVRDMFDQAKKHAPCIIFIDEIDAVGRRRGAGLGGGHDEREQTLNQLLVEMDGFEGNEGIIIIAATNRPDILDKALLRPGRFDRQVTVGLPDVRGREQILNVHMRRVPAGDDVELKYIARGTPGFSGADLANLVNEAALFAARNNRQTVGMAELEKAKDKIIMGVERRTLIMSEEERKLTAYHEAGHCIVGRLVPEHDPVYKVSIMPRGRALGVTLFLPERDQYSASRQKLESQISSLFGGRIAEKLIFGPHKVTTGASNDIERATELARNMATKWGLSERLGPLAYSDEQSQPFLGASMTQTKSISEETARIIDEEVRSLVDRNYERAENTLRQNLSILHEMADALLEWETIDRWQIDDLMAGRKAGPPKDRNEMDRSGASSSDAGSGGIFPGGPIPGHASVRVDRRKLDNDTSGHRDDR